MDFYLQYGGYLVKLLSSLINEEAPPAPSFEIDWEQFFDFCNYRMAWETEDEYMFGPDILVAPVMEENVTERTVYLPEGAQWTDANTKKVYKGGQTVTVPAPIDIIPVFVREGRELCIYE